MNIVTRWLAVILTLLLLVVASSSASYSSDPDYRAQFPVPEVPVGLQLCIYGPLPSGILGFKWETKEDWKSEFIRLGVDIPKEGFVRYFRPARVLVVAADSEAQEQIRIMLE